MVSTSASSSDNTKNIIRVINAVFHPDNFESFLTLNDCKNRKDFKIGTGANILNFWGIIADQVNDHNNIDLDEFMVLSTMTEEYRKYVKIAEDSGYLPVGCSLQTGLTCKAMIKSVIKIRASVMVNMHKSGHNVNDPYVYTTLAIKRHNFVRSVSQFAAYYFVMACTDHPRNRLLSSAVLGKVCEVFDP